MRPLLAIAAALWAAGLLASTEAQEAPAHASHGTANGHAGRASPYAGQEARAVAGLSNEDVAALRRGEGWGLALRAELNGVPGPLHLLELQEELGLDAAPVAALEKMREAMRAEAVMAGERLIAAEAALDQGFRDGDLDGARLRRLVQAAEAAWAELRFAHLARHLETADLLTAEQVEHYTTLRGYGSREEAAGAP